MDLVMDHNNFIFYNDFLTKLFKRQYIKLVMRNIETDELKVIQKGQALSVQKARNAKIKVLKKEFS